MTGFLAQRKPEEGEGLIPDLIPPTGNTWKGAGIRSPLASQQNGLPYRCIGPGAQDGAPSTTPLVGLIYCPGTSLDHGAT